jgi:hypothetical protein
MVEVKHVRRLRGCDPFVLAHQVKQVYYMSYLCENLGAWWVVYRVNPRERLHTPDDSGYHENQVSDGELDEVYQDDELPCSFNINPNLALNSLVGDAMSLQCYDIFLCNTCCKYFMLNGVVDSRHVRAKKAVTSSQSTCAKSSFFSCQSEIEQLKETLRQQDEMQRTQYEAMRQHDDYYAHAFAQQQLILQVS